LATPTWLAYDSICEVFSRARAIENTTSSAVKGRPSENFTPWRSLKIHLVGVSCFHSVASCGTMLSCLSRATRNS